MPPWSRHRPCSLPLFCPHTVAKATRLKRAKDEADAEVAAYKAEREAEFKRKARVAEGWVCKLTAKSTTGADDDLPKQQVLLT